jgi:hypothetical protein
MMRRLLMALVRMYQLTFGAWLRPSCRFHPSCSGYANEALQRHGALAGTYLAVHRIVRCGPWCEGGDDPVPIEKPRLFTHLFPISKNHS